MKNLRRWNECFFDKKFWLSQKNAGSVQVPIFQESVFEGEAVLLLLQPELEVKTDVAALKQHTEMNRMHGI